MPFIFLANNQSLDNKLDGLRGRLKFQRELWNCWAFCFTETWLTKSMLDNTGIKIYSDNKLLRQEKRRRCLLLHKQFMAWVWVSFNQVLALLPTQKVQCCMRVYDPTAGEHGVLWAKSTSYENAHTGEFNQTYLRAVYSKFHQHVTYPTHSANTLTDWWCAQVQKMLVQSSKCRVQQ